MISRRRFLKTTALLSALPLIGEAKSRATRGKELKFIHITDSHMDLQDSDSVEALRLAVNFINKEYDDLDFVLFGGDNFNNNVPGDKDARLFKSIIDKLHCPAYAVAGNKEVSPKPKGDKQSFDDFFSMFVKSKKELKTHGRDWVLYKNGYYILGLNSNIDNQNNGRYTQQTIAFAKRILKKNKPTIILNHHPYTNYWRGQDPKDIHKYVLNNAKEVKKQLFTYKNLILTLSGHKHIDSVVGIYGTKVITTRGFVRPLDLDQYPMRYVHIKEGKIDQKLIYTS